MEAYPPMPLEQIYERKEREETARFVHAPKLLRYLSRRQRSGILGRLDWYAEQTVLVLHLSLF